MALITISQSTGSGDIRIAGRVAEALELELFDDQKLKERALAMGIRSEDLTGFDEKAPGFFDRLLSSKPETYLDIMKAVVYEVSRGGSGVVVGHGSQVLLRNFDCAFHVLIHSSEAARIENLTRNRDVDPDVAKKLIRKSDHERKGFFRFAFNTTWDDPTYYDLIINPQKIGADVAANLIVQGARSDGIKACSLGALEAMDKMSQERLVIATLKKHHVNINMFYCEIPAHGVFEIKGFFNADDDEQRIIDIIRAVPGISEVRSELARLDINNV